MPEKKISNDLFAIVMAGGRGERFWPFSRESKPKPFLQFIDSSSLIAQTIKRLSSFIPAQHIYISVNEKHLNLTENNLPEFPKKNIITEPLSKDTAPCITLASAIIASKCHKQDPVIAIFPADHIINNRKAFAKNILHSAKFAKKTNSIVTIGINPTYPATGFGYIQSGKIIQPNEFSTTFREGIRFIEKPDLRKAKILYKNKKFLWNSGIFLFSLSTLIKALQDYSPELYRCFELLKKHAENDSLSKNIKKIFSSIPKISFDYALMEKLPSFIVAEADFDWDDLGSWDALKKYFPHDQEKNYISDNSILLSSNNNLIVNKNPNQLITLIDTHNTIIVNTPDAILICPLSSTQKIKALLAKFAKNKKLLKYL